MKIASQLILLSAALLINITFASNVLAALAIGSDAPDFKLPDQDGVIHTLEEYRGQWLVIYFYPRDKTPGCTLEAGNFRDSQPQFKKLNTKIVGISLDDVASHKDFYQTMDLNFDLLADENKSVSKSYQVLMDFLLIAYSKRETFIIDPTGRIAYHFDDVDPKVHTQIVLQKLIELHDIFYD